MLAAPRGDRECPKGAERRRAESVTGPPPPRPAQAYVPAMKGIEFKAAEPQLFPDVGIWHPLAPSMYEDLKEYLNW